ncbi:hypothetical protein HZH68_015584 [Vespula germanica]|uniref:Uncharacterized protein n=1 Tax=Vespula germanica TaxID=30212 RepID=A0A834J491_VESGE|nr:hypothetical protein HZH68_015584 [Vespula germanica]
MSNKNSELQHLHAKTRQRRSTGPVLWTFQSRIFNLVPGRCLSPPKEEKEENEEEEEKDDEDENEDEEDEDEEEEEEPPSILGNLHAPVDNPSILAAYTNHLLWIAVTLVQSVGYTKSDMQYMCKHTSTS